MKIVEQIFSLNSKKPYFFGLFLAHFPNSCSKKSISQKTGSVMHNMIRFLAPCQNSKEPNNPFQETPGQTAQWKDGQTLFHRTIATTTMGPTSTTAVDWHLKVKDIDYHV